MNRIKKLGTVVLLLLSFSGLMAKTYQMKFAFQFKDDIYEANEASFANVFKSYVESMSNGQIKVKLFPGGVLGKERENFVNVQNNVIQATLSSVGGIAQFYEPITVVDIPFAFANNLVAWNVYDGWFGKKLRADIYKNTGVRCFATTETGGFFAFTNSKREVKSPKDMKGLKFRTMENAGHIKMVSLMGASAVPIAWLELYTSLQTGVIDGQMNPLPTMLNAKLEEVQKYITLTNHLYGTDWFMVNDKWYNSLPADLQKIVRDGAQVANIADRGAQRILDALAVKGLQEKGLKIYKPTNKQIAQFRNMVQKDYISWLEKENSANKTWIKDFQKAIVEAEEKE